MNPDFRILFSSFEAEHRADLHLSTRSEYVEAVGGKLEIRAVFPGREVRVSQFEGLPK